MLSYEDALTQVLQTVTPSTPQSMPLGDAAGLVLAEPVAAAWDMPRCDNSAMDGFAISGCPDDLDTGLAIIGASYAGHPFQGELNQGEAIRITTGAPLPRGADTVIPVEETEEEEKRVRLTSAPRTGQHVRYQGEEYRAGEILIEAGAQLQAGGIGLLASAGVTRVNVFPRPKVAVISTGDELVELGQQPGPGQIVNSNLHLLRTRLLECGCTPICLGIGTDDPDRLEDLIGHALGADLILSTGGVSVGEKDHVQAALEQHNFRKLFWKVAIKPGKPILFGLLDNTPYFGLPGNPAATAATFELFVKPAIKILTGHSNVLPARRTGTLTDDVKGGGKRQAFLWCNLEWQGSGYQVSVRHRQGSGQNRSIQGANALLSLPIGTDRLAAGELVDVLVIE